jgi:predicted ribonuclease YlaK
MKDALLAQERDGAMLRSGSEVATRVSLDRELEMIKMVNRGIGTVRPIDEKKVFVPDSRLNVEQRSAVEFALRSHDRAIGIKGAAGTGKTL